MTIIIDNDAPRAADYRLTPVRVIISRRFTLQRDIIAFEGSARCHFSFEPPIATPPRYALPPPNKP